MKKNFSQNNTPNQTKQAIQNEVAEGLRRVGDKGFSDDDKEIYDKAEAKLNQKERELKGVEDRQREIQRDFSDPTAERSADEKIEKTDDDAETDNDTTEDDFGLFDVEEIFGKQSEDEDSMEKFLEEMEPQEKAMSDLMQQNFWHAAKEYRQLNKELSNYEIALQFETMSLKKKEPTRIGTASETTGVARDKII